MNPKLRHLAVIIATGIAILACSPAPAGATLTEVAVPRDALDRLVSCSTACLIRVEWAGTGQGDRAVRIAQCESGLQADPPHNNPHFGVFQMGRREFARFGPPGGNIFNRYDNIRAAHNYWDYGNRHMGDLRGSWRPWACRG